MKWYIDRDNRLFSNPYRLYRSIQGWDAWIYNKHGAACLGKGIPTIDQAKAICESHKAREREDA